MRGGEGVGEERARGIGERVDDVADSWREGGRPRGVAGVEPEGVVGGE